jgi:osmoprotectant transport system permease protein
VALDDPRHAIPPCDAIVLLAPKRAALGPLLGKIDIATMREANLRAAGRDGESSPDAVAVREDRGKLGNCAQFGRR